MGFFLDPFKFPKQEFSSIFDDKLFILFVQGLSFSTGNMLKNSMIYRKSLQRIQMLDQLQTHGTPYPSIPE